MFSRKKKIQMSGVCWGLNHFYFQHFENICKTTFTFQHLMTEVCMLDTQSSVQLCWEAGFNKASSLVD